MLQILSLPVYLRSKAINIGHSGELWVSSCLNTKPIKKMKIITKLKKIAENIDMLAMKHKHKHLTATDTWMLVNI
jgi:hypothetical protein